MEQKIEAFHLKKSFLTAGKKEKKTAVNDVSFCLEKGKVVSYGDIDTISEQYEQMIGG